MTRPILTPIPLFETDGNSTCPLGMAMSQNRMAVPTWSYAMERVPPRRIIEIGTGNGGFTTALAVHAHMIGATITTYDQHAPGERFAPLARQLGVEFHNVDVWKVIDDIGLSIQLPGVTYVLCDGGDKPREFTTLAAALKPGDVIASHDYDACHEIDPGIPQLERYWPWTEIRPHQVKQAVDRHGLVPFFQEYFDIAGWLAYRKPFA